VTPRARLAILVALAACAVTTPARAMDPSTADRDAQQALADGPYTFCKHPPKPLPGHAGALCEFAKDVPNCEGLVRACEVPKDEPSTWRFEWLRHALEALARVGVWLLVVAIVLLLAIPLVQGILRARRDKKVADARPTTSEDDAATGEPVADVLASTDAERLLRQAEELATQGKLDRALFVFLQASLRALDDRGAIRLERHRTHGEYVRTCRDDAAKRPLRELVRDVDRVRFGGARTDDAGLVRARERAVALVRAAALVVLALGLAGCGQAKRYIGGADPSGNGLFADLLTRQGAKVSGLETSLATLPFPRAGDGAVLVVDAERVPLADETREHLLAWVEKGGVLVLAGEPNMWPKELGAKETKAPSRDVRAREIVESEDDEDAEALVVEEPALLARAAALEGPIKPRDVVARFSDGKIYAGMWRRGTGRVLGFANDDLFTNVGLARPGNPRALVRILSNLHRNAFLIARAEDGVVPPSSPLAALVEAGLGKALAHCPFAIALLFAAAGARLGRARPSPPPARRAFAEHVEATGALYARTKVAAYALRTYARYADGQLRAVMPRGTTDVGAFLAARAGLPEAECVQVWRRAEGSLAGAEPAGDELVVLKELSKMVAQAIRR
jgi:Domain of unknown function (DUF4350)/Domain of unknown function (DUF4129)